LLLPRLIVRLEPQLQLVPRLELISMLATLRSIVETLQFKQRLQQQVPQLELLQLELA
jgi:hypothetical protein